jgi:alpha-tubulin suppressor-like RCC1 family protein
MPQTLGTTASGHNINALWTWGLGTLYRLGNNSTSNVLSPAQIETQTDWEWISAGVGCGAGIRNGRLFTWGDNTSGRTGQGTTSGTTNTPTQVGSDTDWQTVSISAHGLAIKGGKLYAWGAAANGRLGNGTTTPDVSAPTEINGDTDWQWVASGNIHSVAIKGGKLYTWGSNANYRTGQGTNLGETTTPTQVGSATNWKKVVSGGGATIALDNDGKLWSVGANANGGTGQGTTSGDTTALTQIGSDSDWQDMAPSTGACFHAIKNNQLRGWGRNLSGQIGDNSTTTRSSHVLVDSNSGWVLARGNSGNVDGNGFSLAIRDNKLFTWGAAAAGRLGNGTTTPDVLVPTQVGTATDWKAVTGQSHAQAIRG